MTKQIDPGGIFTLPGTERLRENLGAAALKLPKEIIANLETINEMSEAITKSSTIK